MSAVTERLQVSLAFDLDTFQEVLETLQYSMGVSLYQLHSPFKIGTKVYEHR